MDNPFKGKIIVYGSSITQGASASRPGLAYPSQLSRSSGYQFINMGLSGNGKMELPVAKMLSQIMMLMLLFWIVFPILQSMRYVIELSIS